MRNKQRKMTIRLCAAMLLAALFAFAAVSCGVPAPSGMYAPEENKGKYVEASEHAIFSVPEDFTVTMSSNALAAQKDGVVFSLQCRHSDYCYVDGEGNPNLKRNYNELKTQLTSLYGAYEETLDETKTVAGQKAIEARYSLTVSGEKTDYVQYFFYEKNEHFYLFSYSAPTGQLDESLLARVLASVSLDKENYTAPEGMKKVESAAVKEITFDKYEIYIPDDWILDTSAGQICMRVPSSSVFATILFHEIDCTEGIEKYAADYAAKYAADVDLSSFSALEKYIVASVDRMIGEYKEFKIVTDVENAKNTTALSKNTLLSQKNDYLQTYSSPEHVEFSYIEYTAKLANFNKHGSGGLFTVEEDNGEPEEILYRVRQYFTYKGNTLYFFTYIAKEPESSGAADTFGNYEADALKVIKNFILK